MRVFMVAYVKWQQPLLINPCEKNRLKENYPILRYYLICLVSSERLAQDGIHQYRFLPASTAANDRITDKL